MLRDSFYLNFWQHFFNYKVVIIFFFQFTVKIDKIRLFKNNGHVFWSCNLQLWRALATFLNISKMCKIEKFQRNLSTIFLKLLNIYLFSKIFQKVKIVMLRWNILQYLKKMLREYFSCNERLEIFLTYFCNILCYVGKSPTKKFPEKSPLEKGHYKKSPDKSFLDQNALQKTLEKNAPEKGP